MYFDNAQKSFCDRGTDKQTDGRMSFNVPRFRKRRGTVNDIGGGGWGGGGGVGITPFHLASYFGNYFSIPPPPPQRFSEIGALKFIRTSVSPSITETLTWLISMERQINRNSNI